MQVGLLAPHPLQAGLEVIAEQLAPVLALDAAPAPVELEQDVGVEVVEDLVQVDVDLAYAVERRLRDGGVGAGGAPGRVGDRGEILDRGHGGLAQLLGRVARLGHERLARLRVDQLVHLGQALERVLAVEHAGLVDLVGLGAVRIEDAQPEVAVDRGAADQHGELVAVRVQLLDAGGHLLGGRDEQGGEADGGGLVLDGGVDDGRDRHLLAQVDDRVAVVGQDRVDQRLADVVDVAEHGGDHDRALGVALDLVQVALELGHGALHHLGRLEHEGEDQLAGAELVADLLHRRQQDVVQRGDGADLLDALVDPILHAVLLAAEDVEVQGLLGLHVRGRVGLGLCLGGALGLEVGDEALERVLAAVEHQVVGELALLLRDLAVRRDVVGVDHRQVEPRLHAVVQEHAVERAAGRHADAEADVGDAEGGLDTRDVLLDLADPLDRLDRAGLPLVVAGCEGEREAVEDERLAVEAVLIAAELGEALGDLELALRGLRHPDLVDRQGDERRAVGLGDRDDRVELGPARLEVDRVDDRAAGDLLERGLDHVGLGRVDLDRRRLGEADALDHLAHLVGLVLALGQRHADVEHVGATVDLVLGHVDQAVVVVGQQQLLGLAAALRVDALADQRGAGVLDERRRRDHARDVGVTARGAGLCGLALHPLGDGLDVGGRGPTAASDDRDAVALDELAEDVGELLGLLGEDRLAVRALEGQAGVGDAVHGLARGLGQEADRVAHVLGAGGAVQADHVDLQCLEGGQDGADVRAEEHLAAVGEERDGALDGDGAARLLERLAGAEHGGLDLEDVLGRLDDDQVRATVDQAAGLLVEHGHELGEADLAEGRVVAGGEEAGGADRAGDEAALARGLARDLGRLEVDLLRVLLQPPLGELQARGLEGVGLQHLGAGLEHRGVHALDHVGAVEHERLVAAPGEPVVVLQAQVELLERRSHAAVVDEDAVTGGGQEISHRGHASNERGQP